MSSMNIGALHRVYDDAGRGFRHGGHTAPNSFLSADTANVEHGRDSPLARTPRGGVRRIHRVSIVSTALIATSTCFTGFVTNGAIASALWPEIAADPFAVETLGAPGALDLAERRSLMRDPADDGERLSVAGAHRGIVQSGERSTDESAGLGVRCKAPHARDPLHARRVRAARWPPSNATSAPSASASAAFRR